MGGMLALAGLALAAAVLQRRGNASTREGVSRSHGGRPGRAHELKPAVIAPEQASAAAEGSSAVGPAVPPLLGLSPPSSGAAPAGPVRVAVETSSARPGVGQPLDLAARLAGGATGHPRVEGAKFRIAGPGIAPGTELTAVDDGSGVLRTTFTFLQPGRFEVTFAARADGAPVRAMRLVVVDDPSAPGGARPGAAGTERAGGHDARGAAGEVDVNGAPGVLP